MKTLNEFVAVNAINCKEDYKLRFEQLFATRAHAIDTMPGFIKMHVLKPQQPDGQYLIVSYWSSEEAFKTWTQSPQYIEGQKRGFEDIAKAKKEGKEAPMSSSFKTYEVISN